MKALPPRSSTALMNRARMSLEASAYWRGGLSNAAFVSFRCIPEDRTTMPTGMRMVISRRTMTITPGVLTSPLRAFSRISSNAGFLMKHWSFGAVNLAASRPRNTRRAPVATTIRTDSPCGWPGAESRAVSALARPTNWGQQAWASGSTSRTCTPPS